MVDIMPLTNKIAVDRVLRDAAQRNDHLYHDPSEEKRQPKLSKMIHRDHTFDYYQLHQELVIGKLQMQTSCKACNHSNSSSLVLSTL